MIRTRVGYAGGTMTNPKYYDLGNHSETIQIEYNPVVITYEKLLDVFWESHDATIESYSSQYRSIIFYHDEKQERQALKSKERQEASRQVTIFTTIQPFRNFYLAEDYHQKYYLRQFPELMESFSVIYPDLEEFVSSTAAARVNGYAGGFGELERLEKELNDYGLSEKGVAKLLEITANGLTPGCECM
ncbi:MAG: peptide-methionine (S)-S-oxide reductase [Deltaproteobacteria bacterium]|nr:peptide-methionine (S)-S-oxide reductase [Deltaproteobacteria bacterium]